VSDPPTPIGVSNWGGWVGGVLLLALLGAVITWIYQESSLHKALFLGIGLPSLIQVAGLQSQQNARPSDKAQPPVTSLSFISSAYAQDSAPIAEGLVIPGRKLTAVVANSGGPSPTIVFFSRNGEQIGTKPVTSSASAVIDVPESATAFAVRVGESSSQPLQLPDTPDATKTAEIKIRTATASGFLQALGFAGLNQYDITVSWAQPLPVAGGFCKFGIQSNTDGTWSERLFDAPDSPGTVAIPTPGTLLIATQDINVRSDFPEHVEGKGLYFRPITGLLRNGQKVIVKKIIPFKLAKETHYWMEFAPVDKP
jgi:hypothetical protein